MTAPALTWPVVSGVLATALRTHPPNTAPVGVNARLETELRRSQAAANAAVEVERDRLRGELHDRAQIRLVALQIRVGLACERIEDVALEVTPRLAGTGDHAEAAEEELRARGRRDGAG